MIRRACAAAALLAVAIGTPARAADAFAVDPFDRGWFGVVFGVAGETGPEFDIVSTKIGFVFRGRWGELQYAPFTFLSVNGYPPDIRSGEFGPLYPAGRLTGPWRLAPFFEARTDMFGQMFDGDQDTRIDRAIGLRYQVDRHLTVEVAARRYYYDGIDRNPPLPPIDIRTETFSLGVEWEF